MIYHLKDPYKVKQFFGYKNLKRTEFYITIERTTFGEYNDEFVVKITEKPGEELFKMGLEFI
ncbi:MAG: hypothetical protein QXD04_00805 [Candidatus Bathyarchaeia archaeon]|nr:hypothetical protein [Candidatus Bathyarchaeota archaeon]